jgi:hypothetical protein
MDNEIELNADIRIESIGKLDTYGGSDQYVLLTRLDDDLTAAFAENWLLPQVYSDTNIVGGWFCNSVTAVDLPFGNKCIVIIHHKQDI